ncbi:hypothetical protein EAF00_010909 [Botryotinia globosa]|nr:hypothetical protein EAF00_010909 [Botryotinia globosa]
MWLKMCDKHDTCRGTTPSILPIRVIDVKSSPPKLVMGNGIIDKYVTLSHCWGISKEHPFEAQYTTQTSTLSSRMEGMPLEDLPSTFRDAVIATRDMGFQYLWIDFICILQDSIPDKSIEIARMGDVYGNAALCICATSGIPGRGLYKNVFFLPVFYTLPVEGCISIVERDCFMETSPEQELTENDLAGLRVEAGFIKTHGLGLRCTQFQ